MSPHAHPAGAEIRARLAHPIIDGDAHINEFYPGFLEAIDKVGGPDSAGAIARASSRSGTGGGHRGGDFSGWVEQSWEERRRWRTRRPAWWGMPTKNLRTPRRPCCRGCSTNACPSSAGISRSSTADSASSCPLSTRRRVAESACRALNSLQADMYAEYADRMCPVAVIPMYDAARRRSTSSSMRSCVCGHKVIMIPSGVPRPIPGLHETAPQAFPDAHWIDAYGVDSEHDYDPFWQRCVELGVAVTAHAGTLPTIPWSAARSPATASTTSATTRCIRPISRNPS